MNDLRPDLLRTFLAVSEERHFTRAARRLGVAPSAVSQQMRRLEDMLGAELFTRTSRSVTPTRAGQQLAASAPELLAQHDRLLDDVRAVAAGQTGVVTLGAQAAALLTIVPAVIRRLRASAPRVVLRVRQHTSAELVDALRSGAVDLALLRAATADHAHLPLRPLAPDPLRAVLAHDHPLAAASEIELADLAGEPIVLWGRHGAPELFDQISRACLEAGFTPRIEHLLRGPVPRLAYVAAGLGAGLEPSAYEWLHPEGVRFVALRGDPIRADLALGRSPGSTDALVDRVADEILAVAA